MPAAAIQQSLGSIAVLSTAQQESFKSVIHDTLELFSHVGWEFFWFLCPFDI